MNDDEKALVSKLMQDGTGIMDVEELRVLRPLLKKPEAHVHMDEYLRLVILFHDRCDFYYGMNERELREKYNSVKNVPESDLTAEELKDREAMEYVLDD